MRRVTPKPAMSFGSARLPPPRFAGRKPELGLLHQGLDYLLQTGDPYGGIVLITGVPGIGKTQLTRRFAEDAQGRHKGVVSCAVAAGHKHREAYYDMVADKMGPDRGAIHPLVKLMRDRKAASLTYEEATLAVRDGGREDGGGISSFHPYMQQSLSRAEARAQSTQGSDVGR